MLIDAWEGFMEFSPLLNQTISMCRRHKADILLVEAKNIGQSIEQEIRRMFGGKEWSTLFSVPKGDKVARLISVQHMWSGDQVVDPKTGMKTWTGGVIWAPDKEWAQLVLDRVGSFPKGKRKGIVDTVSQAIKYLRDNGIILRPQEYDEERLEERRYRRQRGPAYDV